MQEQYGGLSEQMAGTYEAWWTTWPTRRPTRRRPTGKATTRSGKRASRPQNGLAEQRRMDEANRAIGAWQAELENAKEQYQREAVEA